MIAIRRAGAGGRTAGFVRVLARVESEEVTDLVVLEPHRRSGVGMRLMEAAEAHARASEAKRIRVSVLAANGAAHELYRRLGYREYQMVLEKVMG